MDMNRTACRDDPHNNKYTSAVCHGPTASRDLERNFT